MVEIKNDGMMWALVKEKPEEGLWMKRVPIPEVGPNDVKIKIHKTAICGQMYIFTSGMIGHSIQFRLDLLQDTSTLERSWK